MKQIKFLPILALIAFVTHADEGAEIRTAFKPLQFLIGWCWAGQFPDGKQTDIHCYESVFDGMHIRDRHVVTGGTTLYQGETIYSWSQSSNAISYVYWNSNGGVSKGTVTPRPKSIAFPDESYTGTDGSVIVISSSWENITPDGYDSLTVETFANGTTKERKLHYQKEPFTKNPAEAK